MTSTEMRFKIVALLVIKTDMPSEFQRKVDIIAQMIDRKSEFALNAVVLLERKVLDYQEKMDLALTFELN